MKAIRIQLAGWVLGVFLWGGVLSAHDYDDDKSVGNSAGANFSPPPSYAAHRIELLSHLMLNEIGNLGASDVIGNDIWGWTDSASGREFALFGLTNGTSFIEVTNPRAPRYLGTLQGTPGTTNRAWRDMKVYNNQAYIVADNTGSHGVQTFDLRQLLTAGVSDPNNPNYFTSAGVYTGVTEAHNIFINENSGFAYVVGSNQASRGLHVLDLNGGGGTAMPTFAGNFSADGYTHDTQVVSYIGPDTNYAGREVAFNSNEDTLTIVDVTNKSNMTQISRTGYAGSEYSHQGWLSEDQQFFFMDDELDELRADDPIQTRTRVWDVSDLENPLYLGYHEGEEATIDHNLYVKGDLIFQANYTSGMRVLKINDAATLDLEEYAFIDTYDADNNISFNGAWSVFPYFDSGTVIISDRQNGLFIVSVVPEPGSLGLISLMGLICLVRRRRS